MSSITGPPPVQHEPPPPPAPPPSQPPPPRKRHPVRWIAALAAVLVVAIGAGIGISIGVGGGQKTPAPSQEPQLSAPHTTNVGDTMHITRDGVEVLAVTVSSVDVTTQPTGQSSKAPANGYFVIAHVKVSVMKDFTEGFVFWVLDFSARVNGRDYWPNDDNASYVGSTFEGGELGPGESASGTIAFDVPAAHGEIGYTPYESGQLMVLWRFPASGTGV